MVNPSRYTEEQIKLRKWFDEKIYEIQAQYGDTPEKMDVEFNKLDQEYDEKLRSLEKKHSVKENYEKDKRQLELEFWAALDKIDPTMGGESITKREKAHQDYQEKFAALRSKHDLPQGGELFPKEELTESWNIAEKMWQTVSNYFLRVVELWTTQS